MWLLEAYMTYARMGNFSFLSWKLIVQVREAKSCQGLKIKMKFESLKCTTKHIEENMQEPKLNEVWPKCMAALSRYAKFVFPNQGFIL